MTTTPQDAPGQALTDAPLVKWPTFTGWRHENLAKLAAELMEQNEQLRADLRAAIDAYRNLILKDTP